MKESTIQAAILAKLRGIGGVMCWKISDRFQRGLPDIVGVRNGRFFAVEVKTKDGRQTELQKQTAVQIEAVGGVYVLARSVSDAITSLTQRGIL